jgi:myo-inositol-1(or 4)-monophosphatase
LRGLALFPLKHLDRNRPSAPQKRCRCSVRRLGSAALDLCCVACGWLDGFWERHIKSWDLVAGAAILIGAGGQVCDPDGGPFVAQTGCILASNGRIHPAMLDELHRLAR